MISMLDFNVLATEEVLDEALRQERKLAIEFMGAREAREKIEHEYLVQESYSKGIYSGIEIIIDYKEGPEHAFYIGVGFDHFRRSEILYYPKLKSGKPAKKQWSCGSAMLTNGHIRRADR